MRIYFQQQEKLDRKVGSGIVKGSKSFLFFSNSTDTLCYLYAIKSPLGGWSLRLLVLSDLAEVGLPP